VASLIDGCLVLRHIQHRHILQALGVYSNEQEPVMVLLAKTTFGTLKQFLDDIRLQGGPQSSYGKVCCGFLFVCHGFFFSTIEGKFVWPPYTKWVPDIPNVCDII